METWRRGQHLRERVHHERSRRGITVDAAGDLHRQPRQAFDFDRIVRFGRAQVRFHVEADHRLLFPVADPFLNDAAYVALFDHEAAAPNSYPLSLRVALPSQAPGPRGPGL